MAKVNFRVKRLWEELQALIIPINSDDTDNPLNALKTWIESNQKMLQQGGLGENEALALLLEGKASEFPMSKPEAGEYFKSLITFDIYFPNTIKNIVDTLETAVREFAIFTKWEDCPICREGYLGYWINIDKNKIILHCPECGWEDLQEDERTGTARVLPASIQNLVEHGIIGERGQHL
jgi:hypothetical protein